MTGNRVPGAPTTVEELTAELHAVPDEYLAAAVEEPPEADTTEGDALEPTMSPERPDVLRDVAVLGLEKQIIKRA